MLFRMQSNMLFRLFPLLTAQAGFAPVDICLISENCYRRNNSILVLLYRFNNIMDFFVLLVGSNNLCEVLISDCGTFGFFLMGIV